MYLTKKQVVEKYHFLTPNMLKNFLYKNINDFRKKVVHRVGRRIFLNEQSLLQFFADNKDGQKGVQ